ncbi:hypothetical protein AAFF_G00065360 [Aldrovandia affinis]|uniref:Uncharacterized protein n=1 Tax=Aldrovandia affinis TaxID=143900 RepID=A0AAD7WYT8_9TELE|nr:hypothetical protein AAFF_G00065360 [Aldrovandia affinis]
MAEGHAGHYTAHRSMVCGEPRGGEGARDKADSPDQSAGDQMIFARSLAISMIIFLPILLILQDPYTRPAPTASLDSYS